MKEFKVFILIYQISNIFSLNHSNFNVFSKNDAEKFCILFFEDINKDLKEIIMKLFMKKLITEIIQIK